MTYVQVDRGLATHPKTRHLARLIDQHPRYAIGLLYEVWDWAMTAKPDGMIGEVPRETIQGVFGFKKDLVAVLIEAGFVCDQRCLGRRGDHRSGRFHDWDEHSGGFLREKERNRLSHEHARRNHLRPADNCPRCEALSGGQPGRAATTGAIDRSRSGGTGRTDGSLSGSTVPTVPTVRNTPYPHTVAADTTEGTGDGTTTTADRAAAIVSEAHEPWRAVLQDQHEKAANAGTLQSFVTHFGDTQYLQREGTHVLKVRDDLERGWIAHRYASEIHEILGADLVIEVRT